MTTKPTLPVQGRMGDILRAVQRADIHTVLYCETGRKGELEVALLAAKQMLEGIQAELKSEFPSWTIHGQTVRR
jgi:hypothetical protein